MEDNELISRILRGEDVNRCFAELVEKYRTVVYTVLLRMTGDRRDAEDLLQETWIVAFRRLGRFDPERAKLSTYLCAIAIGLCRHLWRTRKRVARGEACERRCCLRFNPGPEEAHERVVWHERLWKVLDGLPRLWQALLVLHVQEGWSYPQLAAAFGFTVRHAEYETHKALEAARSRAEEMRRNGWRFDGAH